MESLLTLVGLAVVVFVSTNIDDIVLLVAFLANPKYRMRDVVAGQFAGIGVLYGASVVASLVSLVVEPEHVAWLGLVPIALGVKELFERDDDADDTAYIGDGSNPEAPQETTSADPSLNAVSRVMTVAAVTIANGADNLGVYIPVFAVRSFADIALIGILFILMTALWCAAAHWLVHHSAIGAQVRRYAARSVPFVLIAIGLWILIEPRLD